MTAPPSRCCCAARPAATSPAMSSASTAAWPSEGEIVKPFVKLADPSTYVACSWDLAEDNAGRDYWVDFFIKHLETLLALGVAAAVRQGEALGSVQGRAEACRADFVPRF